MKILLLADIHGNIDSLRRILAAVRHADLALLLGDITDFGGGEEVAEIVRELSPTVDAVLGVAGNCDYPEAGTRLAQDGVSLHRTARVIGGIAFAGAGGSLPCVGTTPNEMPDAGFRTVLDAAYAAIPAGNPFVLVTHQPAANTRLDMARAGRHVGSMAIREFIEKRQPIAAFCGHIHEAAGSDTIGVTRLMNPGSVKSGLYGIVEIEEASIRRMEMRMA